MKKQNELNKLISLLKEGPILPGGIKTSSSTCGKPNCKCKDKKNPKLHGPYNILSYSLSEKSSTISLSSKEISAAKKMIERFKKAKSLLNQLAIDYSDEARGGNTLEIQCLEENNPNNDKPSIKDKGKLRKQSERNESDRIKIKNLEQSKSTWKKKYKKKTDEIVIIKQENKLKSKQIKQQQREIDKFKKNINDSKKN